MNEGISPWKRHASAKAMFAPSTSPRPCTGPAGTRLTQIRREVSFTKGRIIVRGKRGDPYLYFAVPEGPENTVVSAAYREQQLSSDSKGLDLEKEAVPLFPTYNGS